MHVAVTTNLKHVLNLSRRPVAVTPNFYALKCSELVEVVKTERKLQKKGALKKLEQVRLILGLIGMWNNLIGLFSQFWNFFFTPTF